MSSSVACPPPDILDEFHKACQTSNIPHLVRLLRVCKTLPTAPLGESGETSLHVAVHHNRLNMAEVLLNAGAAVNASRRDGMTPLCVAVVARHLGAAKLLLKADGVDINAVTALGRTPLLLAAAAGDYRMVQLLLQKGAKLDVTDKEGYTPLMTAAIEKRRQVEKLLLDKKADVKATRCDGWTALHLDPNAGHEGMCRALISAGADVNAIDSEGWTPLMTAASEGHLSVVQLLCSRANVNARLRGGFSILYLAATEGHDEIVAALLEAGAEVDAASGRGSTPLSIASHIGHNSVVKTLLAAKAEPGRSRSDGWTPLMLAALVNHAPVAETLLATGRVAPGQTLPPKSPYNAVYTALHVAAEHEANDVLRLLLAKGVPADGGTSGLTPLMLAAEDGNSTAVRWLMRAGASVCAVVAGDDSTAPPRTALSSAAAEGHAIVVEELLCAGKRTGLTSSMVRGARSAAQAAGHGTLAQWLRDQLQTLSQGGDKAHSGVKRGGGGSPPLTPKRWRSGGAHVAAERGSSMAVSEVRPARRSLPSTYVAPFSKRPAPHTSAMAAAVAAAASAAAATAAAAAAVVAADGQGSGPALASKRPPGPPYSPPDDIKREQPPPPTPGATILPVPATASAAEVAAAFVAYVGTGFTVDQVADLAPAVIPVAVKHDMTGVVVVEEDPDEMVKLFLAKYKDGAMPWGSVRRGRRFFLSLQKQL